MREGNNMVEALKMLIKLQEVAIKSICKLIEKAERKNSEVQQAVMVVSLKNT